MKRAEPPYFGDLSEPYKTLESHITPENETNSSVSTKFQNPDKTWKVPATVGGALYFGRQPGDRIVKRDPNLTPWPPRNTANNPQIRWPLQ